MVRPRCPRKVAHLPPSDYFKPRGIPLTELEEVVLNVEEYEAIRWADYEGLYQEQISKRMGISRATVGRVLESARKKIADVLVNGKSLKIQGGDFKLTVKRHFVCRDCGHTWQESFGSGHPQACPECKSGNIHREKK